MGLGSRGKGQLGSLGIFMVSSRHRNKAHSEVITVAFKVHSGGKPVGIEKSEMVGYLPEAIAKLPFPSLNLSHSGPLSHVGFAIPGLDSWFSSRQCLMCQSSAYFIHKRLQL